MKKKVILVFFTVMSLIVLSSHDMFLKLKTYYLQPRTETVVYLYNGTFDKSENAIDEKRMKDVSLVNPGEKVVHPTPEQWTEENKQTLLKIKTGKEGTAVVGLSTQSNMIELSAKDFGEYLKHDGILDVLEARKKSGDETKPAKEKYSKHVKAIFQIGSTLSDEYKTVLGYPIEFVPQVNPYSLKKGGELTVQLLKDEKPLAGELVYASHAAYHGHGDDGTHLEAVKTRTDGKGVVKLKLSETGHWYLRTICMKRAQKRVWTMSQIGQRLRSK